MPSIERKINIFKQELLQKIAKDREEKVSRAQEQADQEIKNADILLNRQKDQIIERYDKLEQRNVNKILSEGSSKAQDLVLDTKKKIRDDFKRTLLNRAKAFLKDNKYQDYLESCVIDIKNQIPQPESLILFSNDSDLQLIKQLKDKYLPDYQIEYKVLPEQEIGGIVIRDQDERTSFDYSIRNRIDENSHQTELLLMQSLEEV